MALPLLAFAVLAAIFWFRLGTGDPSRIPSALIGRPAPQTALPPLEGLLNDGAQVPALDPAMFKRKVSVVNVWASWCVPCHEEAPLLTELARDKRLQFRWRPWRRHEFEASLTALLKPSWDDTPNALFHVRFYCCNCTRAWLADGFAVDGPDDPACRQIGQNGARSESRFEDGTCYQDGACRQVRAARHQFSQRRRTRRAAGVRQGVFGCQHQGPSLQGQGRVGAKEGRAAKDL